MRTIGTWEGVVLNADSVPDASGDTFDIAGVVFPKHDVAVVMDIGHHSPQMIGVASLNKEGTSLKAKIELFQPTKVHGIPLYPSVIGKILERNDKHITKCVINQIALTMARNSDERIKPFTLGENMENVTKQELDQMETEVTASLEFSRKTDAKMTVQKLEKELSIIRLAKKGLEK